MSQTIGIDMDGIVVSFEHGYAPLLTSVSGIDFPEVGSREWPRTWDWEKDAGVTNEQAGKVWGIIKGSDTFWFDLPPHEGAEEFLGRINRLSPLDFDIYFITNRMGREVKSQTEEWLIQHGFGSPTVLISGQKGNVANALNLDLYIDDKDTNCLDVVEKSPRTRCLVLDRPYNRGLEGVERMKDLDQFWNLIKDGGENGRK